MSPGFLVSLGGKRSAGCGESRQLATKLGMRDHAVPRLAYAAASFPDRSRMQRFSRWQRTKSPIASVRRGRAIMNDQAVGNQLTEAKQIDEYARGEQTVIEAVHENAQLILDLTHQFDTLRSELATNLDSSFSARSLKNDDDGSAADSDDVQQWQEECDRLHRRVLVLEDELDESRKQNGTLAAKLANQSVAAVASSPAESGESLTWEERKQLIMDQMENESASDHTNGVVPRDSNGDANLQSESESALIGRLQAEVEASDREVAELRQLLEQQSQTCDGGVAIGAAAIAEMIDDDELIQQERARLQQLQKEWEEKFREGEIEASLERAKLSRERQEVARQKVELEVQLERLHRELKDSDGGGSTRRWLTKLGLSDADQSS